MVRCQDHCLGRASSPPGSRQLKDAASTEQDTDNKNRTTGAYRHLTNSSNLTKTACHFSRRAIQKLSLRGYWRYAALSTAFDEAAAAWGAKMKKTFGTVIDSRISTEPHKRMHENMPQGNSHHKRCGAIDWHTGPTLDQCSGGDHLEGTSPDDGMNGSPQRISSADSIETLEEPSCSTSGETTKA